VPRENLVTEVPAKEEAGAAFAAEKNEEGRLLSPLRRKDGAENY